MTEILRITCERWASLACSNPFSQGRFASAGAGEVASAPSASASLEETTPGWRRGEAYLLESARLVVRRLPLLALRAGAGGAVARAHLAASASACTFAYLRLKVL
eukprot:6204685-Pleurochrysis_carterae.AAC.3